MGGVLILNLSNRWRSAVRITLRPHYPGNELRYPLSRMLGGQQSRSGRYGEEKIIFPLPGFETWTVQPLVWSLYTLRILITHGRWQLSVANYALFFPLSRLVKYRASRKGPSNLLPSARDTWNKSNNSSSRMTAMNCLVQGVMCRRTLPPVALSSFKPTDRQWRRYIRYQLQGIPMPAIGSWRV
jgi:hypothetical protein